MSIDCSGRVALVTGGTRGIGAGIATRLLAAGATVVVCGRHDPDELPAAEEARATFTAADVRDPEQADGLVRDVVAAHGRLDVLVNNAGGSPRVDAAEASPRFTEAIVRLNLLAPLFCAQAANAVMQDQVDGGVVVNIASVSGTRPSPGTAAYGAAKAGLLNLTRSLAMEWAPKVRVNAVTAGLVATEAADAHYGGVEGTRAVAATIPLGRMGEPGDVADACLYLVSPLARWVSGTNLVVDGGGEQPPFLEAAADS